MALADRIKNFREKLQRREASVRADRRAKARRIEREEPEGLSETVEVKKRRAKRKAEAAREETAGLAEDARQLVSTEFGVSESEAGSLITNTQAALSKAAEKGQLDKLDLDGDGDTDVLSWIDQADTQQRGRPRRRRQPQADPGARVRRQVPPPEPGAQLGRSGIRERPFDPGAQQDQEDDLDVIDPAEPVVDLGGVTEPEFEPVDVESEVEKELFE